MKPFTDVLRDIRKGKVVDACSEELAEVVRAVLDTDKAGKFTLELTVKPQGRGELSIVLLAKIATKVPQADLPDAIFYTDLDGGLHRDDPNQRELFTPTDGLGDIIDAKTGEVTTRRGA